MYNYITTDTRKNLWNTQLCKNRLFNPEYAVLLECVDLYFKDTNKFVKGLSNAYKNIYINLPIDKDNLKNIYEDKQYENYGVFRGFLNRKIEAIYILTKNINIPEKIKNSPYLLGQIENKNCFKLSCNNDEYNKLMNFISTFIISLNEDQLEQIIFEDDDISDVRITSMLKYIKDYGKSEGYKISPDYMFFKGRFLHKFLLENFEILQTLSSSAKKSKDSRFHQSSKVNTWL